MRFSRSRSWLGRGRGREFVARVKSHGIQLATGYGKLADTTFRIGHMGDHTVSTLERCFEAMPDWQAVDSDHQACCVHLEPVRPAVAV